MMPRATVLLADDHLLVAEGLVFLLQQDFDVVGCVGDGRQLIEAAKRLKPAVIVTDISMPLLNGLDAVRQLRLEGVQSKIVILTQHRETQFAIEAFRAGVSGYVTKQSVGDELVTAVQEALSGRAYLTRFVSEDLNSVLLAARQKGWTEGARLTARQREILQLIAEGKTAKEVANILNISTRTAEGHKYEIMQALGVKTTAELVQQAMRLHLLEP
jgi:DNA-binding NarL/FixJ family response regulator